MQIIGYNQWRIARNSKRRAIISTFFKRIFFSGTNLKLIEKQKIL